MAPELVARRQTSPSPFLKWVGGKRKLLARYRSLLPPDLAAHRYHEPFLGGGALYFALAPGRASLSDLNADLIATYEAVRSDVDALIRALAPLVRAHTPERYYEVRARFNERRDALDPIERAARFIYMNKTGYNGLWRVNSRGHNNVPVGRYAKPSVYDPDLLRADAVLLAGARLAVAPFEQALEAARPGYFVYLDPPYHPLSRTANFTAYAQNGFGESDQRRLADACRELDRRGCRFMLSNSDCVLVRTLYRGFRIVKVQAARSVNRNAQDRGLISELVVRNYES